MIANARMTMQVLIVDSGEQHCKERFLRELTSSSFEFFLLINSSPRITLNRWYNQYVPTTHTLSADFREPRKAAYSVRSQLEARGVGLSGVTSYYEEAVLVTQAIAEELALTPITIGDPSALRNKGIMRKLWSGAGLPQPRFRVCATLDEGVSAVREIGVPCIVKPTQMTASVGVRKISSTGQSEIAEALSVAFTEDISKEDTRFAYGIANEVLVEEYVPSLQEISCEGIVQMGHQQLLAVTKKTLSSEPLFDELGHATPYAVSGQLRVMLEEQLLAATRALKLFSTAFHAEFRLREKAEPVLIELGARLPGGFIPQLVQLSQGIDMLHASLQLAIGQPATTLRRKNRAAAIRFLFSDAYLKQFKNNADRIRALPFIDELAIYGNSGNGRLGHVIWEAQTPDELENGWKTITALR